MVTKSQKETENFIHSNMFMLTCGHGFYKIKHLFIQKMISFPINDLYKPMRFTLKANEDSDDTQDNITGPIINYFFSYKTY